ncbi:MAG: glucose-6-phosphate dehydrogenase [Pseudomonadales bacterium]
MAEAFDIIIFGGMGDLSLRKLIPALYGFEYDGEFTEESRIYITSHRAVESEEFKSKIQASIEEQVKDDADSATNVPRFMQRLNPVVLDIADHAGGWDELAKNIENNACATRIFFLSIPPYLSETCCKNLYQHGLVAGNARIILEKPIGVDLESAQKLNASVAQYFKEDDIYRIDHYLGKETVQNLLALRFTNILLGDVWSNSSIDHVQISISETVGLEGRAGFYNDVGALRDMVQNHLLQLLCLVAMEPPHEMNADNIRAEKLKVLKALKPIDSTNVNMATVRGQYDSGLMDDQRAAGYLEELGTEQGGSNTETYVAIRAEIGNWRWAGVPFYLRTGKRLKRRAAEIVIEFKPVVHQVFNESVGAIQPNRLTIKLQPDEGVELTLNTKQLHQREMKIKPVNLELDFADAFDGHRRAAYQRLILDVVAGDSTLFIHRDEVEEAWRWINPIQDAWKTLDSVTHLYASGSWGPQKADFMLHQDGRSWVEPGDPSA